VLSQARQSAELRAGPAGSSVERRSALAAAVRREEPDGELAQRNAVPAAVQHGEQDGEPGQRNAVAAARCEEPERRNGALAVVRHEEQELPDAESRRPSVFQAVPIRSLPPRRLLHADCCCDSGHRCSPGQPTIETRLARLRSAAGKTHGWLLPRTSAEAVSAEPSNAKEPKWCGSAASPTPK
jgi:hypothetical protein